MGSVGEARHVDADLGDQLLGAGAPDAGDLIEPVRGLSPLAKNKAIIVVAHALLVIIWHVLATGKPYGDLGAAYFTRRLDPGRETRRLVARLEALGHRVTIEDTAA